MKTMAIYLLMLLILFWPATIFGQDQLPEPQMDSGPGGPPPPGLVVPIDSSIIILLISGVLLGIYVVFNFRRKIH